MVSYSLQPPKRAKKPKIDQLGERSKNFLPIQEIKTMIINKYIRPTTAFSIIFPYLMILNYIKMELKNGRS